MTIFRDVEKQLLHKLSELGQGGIDRLHALETAFAAIPEGPEKATAQALLSELHTYGFTAYLELGLKPKSAETFSGSAGQVLLKSGGTGKDNGGG